MAATIRCVRTSNKPSLPFVSRAAMRPRWSVMAALGGEKRGVVAGIGDAEKRPAVAAKAAVVAASTTQITTSEEALVDPGLNLVSLLSNAIATGKVMELLNPPTLKRKQPWKLEAQMLIEKVIIDCRFFTLFAVMGSLLGSVLCFVEGCFIIVQSYVHYFHMLSHKSSQEHLVHLLIEAIDMFLLGTAMLIFGMGLYVTYVGTKCTNAKKTWLPGSNLFGLFHFKMLPSWVQMQSVSEAKSKIGHAVMMILQVGVLEKFKSIPLVTSLDLACFAGAVLLSAASIFVLSRLSVGTILADGR